MELFEPLFRQIEGPRVTFAKHEIPKSKGYRARGAQDMEELTCLLALYIWMVVYKDKPMDIVSRRGIADKCKLLFE